MTRGNGPRRREPDWRLEGVSYFSSSAITDELGVSRQTLWRWRKDGSIPAGHRFRDGRVMFTDDEFQEIRLFANRIEPAFAEIYLDNHATTRPLPEVREAMLEALGAGFGNASSSHEGGERARIRIRQARTDVARLLGTPAETILFTSGATEANNIVLLSTLSRSPTPRIVTTEIEHSSILKCCEYLEERGAEVVYIPPDPEGRIAPERVSVALDRETTLVSVQWVSNETGVIQPINAIGTVCRERGVPFHTDAAQAVGKIRMAVRDSPIDLLALSGHKLHAPPGVGALYVRDPGLISPLLHGGDQEGGRRAGTENLPGIVGLGRAAALRQERWSEVLPHLEALRDSLESKVLQAIPGTAVNGSITHRAPGSTNLRFDAVDGEALVARLDQAGIRCSQGSACTSMRPEPSYVLRSMGLSEEEAYASVRFGFSEENTLEEVDAAVREVADICRSLRAFRGRHAAPIRETAGVES